MKELKANSEIPILQTHFPMTKPRASKRWIYARRNPDKGKVTQNSCVKAAYHRIIKTVKTLYLKPSEIYYDRDMKTDKSEGIFGMHSFLTPSFYWRLDCGLCYDYEVTYAFNNCLYEAETRLLMYAYPLDRVATEKQLQPDFSTYYDTVLRIQDQRFLHSLSGT